MEEECGRTEVQAPARLQRLDIPVNLVQRKPSSLGRLQSEALQLPRAIVERVAVAAYELEQLIESYAPRLVGVDRSKHLWQVDYAEGWLSDKGVATVKRRSKARPHGCQSTSQPASKWPMASGLRWQRGSAASSKQVKTPP